MTSSIFFFPKWLEKVGKQNKITSLQGIRGSLSLKKNHSSKNTWQMALLFIITNTQNSADNKKLNKT